MSDAALLVLIFVAGGAAVAGSVVYAIREWRRLQKTPRSPPLHPTQIGLGGIAALLSGVGRFLGGIVAIIGGLIGCVVVLLLSLAALFVVIWIIKRMWEAA